MGCTKPSPLPLTCTPFHIYCACPFEIVHFILTLFPPLVFVKVQVLRRYSRTSLTRLDPDWDCQDRHRIPRIWVPQTAGERDGEERGGGVCLLSFFFYVYLGPRIRLRNTREFWIVDVGLYDYAHILCRNVLKYLTRPLVQRHLQQLVRIVDNDSQLSCPAPAPPAALYQN